MYAIRSYYVNNHLENHNKRNALPGRHLTRPANSRLNIEALTLLKGILQVTLISLAVSSRFSLSKVYNCSSSLVENSINNLRCKGGFPPSLSHPIV